MVAILGLVSAVVYGASDFFGGLAARRMPALLASTLGSAVAVVGAAIAVLVDRPVWTLEDAALAAVAGVLGAIGTWSFYAGLAIGPMSVVSPGVAMIYAVVPAVVGIALGERFRPVGYVALVAVVGAALLLAVPRQRDGARLTRRAIVLGTIAGLAYAGYIIAMDRTSAASGLEPLLVELAAAFVVFTIVLAFRRARRGPSELAGLRDARSVLHALLAGLLLVVATILLVIGLHLGELAVMGVLNSLYPLGTVLLALVVLRERLSRLQLAGILLAIAASAALALG
ncbi:DMT family transporter [Pseudolysinimonas kribbensis]|uniref:Multidrug transporter n=1 Tax=Pseudolysinimonas kribbensis TaxID=433641 RepID=A0ABQ6K497_9MICO|nr:EamA family transporter [Pseudolysinimonas kribbensis]GMA94129.1 multidrug transporter [Pseudolysinimonas kribbensis]